MKIVNNNSINFGTINYTENAFHAISRRLSPELVAREFPKVINNHIHNKIKIDVDTVEKTSRLSCKIMIPTENKNELLLEYTRKEDLIDRLFLNPINYIKSICCEANAMAVYYGYTK